MKVDIYYSSAERKLECVSVDVLQGTTVSKALPERLAKAIASQGLTCAVCGRAVGLDYVLQVGDRLELVRELRVDPMTARRERFNKQGIKKAGLFKTKRVGAKAGY
jgi:putative ubiquitin-RnfH superfamily antitoxin RatB of RatAB toxin-antitoxin module